ncbi:hypothetical protein GCM10019016_070560 [Streptomyces prasinosporus]|uniref:Uncharacterized protein n=1 Tax=Streptomyces prasinosporus TaxID=68256 RepID=A0ABP6U079_9ACTN
MRLRIIQGPLTYVGRVAISIDIPLRPSMIRRHTVAAELAVPLPVTSFDTTSRAPVVAEDLTAVSGDREVRIARRESRGRLRLVLDGRDLQDSESVRISLTTSSVLHLAAGDDAFRVWRLGLHCTVPSADRVITELAHSPELSLRCRVDNSEYHSLAQSADADLIRKMGFHPGPTVSLKYLLGIHAASNFRALALPAFATSLGLLSGGYTLALLSAGHGDLAAVSLALTLTPPVLQAIKPGASFYRSADIHGRGAVFWISSFSVLAYLAGVLMMLVSVAYVPHTAADIQIAVYALGGASGLAGVAIVTAVHQQIIPPHFCDMCAKRIVWRRRSRLHLASRRTVCRACFARIT